MFARPWIGWAGQWRRGETVLAWANERTPSFLDHYGHGSVSSLRCGNMAAELDQDQDHVATTRGGRGTSSASGRIVSRRHWRADDLVDDIRQRFGPSRPLVHHTSHRTPRHDSRRRRFPHSVLVVCRYSGVEPWSWRARGDGEDRSLCAHREASLMGLIQLNGERDAAGRTGLGVACGLRV